MPPNINKPLVAPVLWAARGNYAPELDIVAYRPVYLVAAATTRATIYKVTPAALVQENGWFLIRKRHSVNRSTLAMSA
jgi:hypothetical protein